MLFRFSVCRTHATMPNLQHDNLLRDLESRGGDGSLNRELWTLTTARVWRTRHRTFQERENQQAHCLSLALALSPCGRQGRQQDRCQGVQRSKEPKAFLCAGEIDKRNAANPNRNNNRF